MKNMRRAIWLVALLLLAVGAEAQDFIKYYPAPVAGTSGGGATFTAPVLLPNGSAAAPSLAWASDTQVGFYKNAQGFNLSNAGVQVAVLSIGGLLFLNYSTPTISLNNGEVVLGVTGLQGRKTKALTDAAAAVSFARIAVATNSSAGGEVIWSAMSTDGTSPLTQVGTTYFAGVNTAGTVTCTVGASGTPITAYSRVNTLACTISAVTSTTNCDLQVTCTDNLAGDQTPVFSWRLDMPVPNTVTPQ